MIVGAHQDGASSTLAVFADLSQDLGSVGVDLGGLEGAQLREPVVDGHHRLAVLDRDEHRIVRMPVGAIAHGLDLGGVGPSQRRTVGPTVATWASPEVGDE